MKLKIEKTHWQNEGIKWFVHEEPNNTVLSFRYFWVWLDGSPYPCGASGFSWVDRWLR